MDGPVDVGSIVQVHRAVDGLGFGGGRARLQSDAPIDGVRVADRRALADADRAVDRGEVSAILARIHADRAHDAGDIAVRGARGSGGAEYHRNQTDDAEMLPSHVTSSNC